MKFLILLSVLMLSSCSDGNKAAFEALGKPRNIECFSGGVSIYKGTSTGKINNEQNSDGYYFLDTNNKLIEINADCVISIEVQKP